MRLHWPARTAAVTEFDPALLQPAPAIAQKLTGNALLQTLMHASPAPIITKELSSVVTRWNPAATALFGWTAEEIIGRSMREVIPERLQPEEDIVLERIRAGETIERFETTRRTRDGGEVEVELTIVPLRDDDGCITGMADISRDLSDRRAREISEQRLFAVGESSEDAIISKDLSGTITGWNEAASRIFGYSAEEAMGRPIQLIVPPDLYDQQAQIRAALESGERIEHFETARLRRDGTQVPVTLSISPIRDHAGTVVGSTKVLRETSQRKEMESLLLVVEKLAYDMRLTRDRSRQIDQPIAEMETLLHLALEEVQELTVRAQLLLAQRELERIVDMARNGQDQADQNALAARTAAGRLGETLRGPLMQ